MEYATDIAGGAIICDAMGKVLAHRRKEEGPGIVIADIDAGRANSTQEVPARFWIQELDLVSKFGWHLQGCHGRRWYKRHVAQRA